jgi:cyclopropane fatty-acyl-phospholipid synthase-like methyltransferase
MVTVISKDFGNYDEKWWDTLYERHTHVSSASEIANHQEVAKIIGNGSVIDFGCGHGYFSEYVVGDYIGVDWSVKGIEKAKEMFKDKIFFAMKFQDFKLPKNKKKFDYAVAFEIFEHLENPKELIEKMLEVATCAIFALPRDHYSESTANSDKPLLTQLGIEHQDYHYANYSQEDIKEMFPDAEIRVKDIDFLVIVR